MTPEASFTNDLGADSLDTVELIMEFEKEFNIAIPDNQAEKISTVGQAIEYIEKNVDNHDSPFKIPGLVGDLVLLLSVSQPLGFPASMQLQTRCRDRSWALTPLGNSVRDYWNGLIQVSAERI